MNIPVHITSWYVVDYLAINCNKGFSILAYNIIYYNHGKLPRKYIRVCVKSAKSLVFSTGIHALKIAHCGMFVNTVTMYA